MHSKHDSCLRWLMHECCDTCGNCTAFYLSQVSKERKEKTTPFGVNSMRSQVLYRAAQVSQQGYTVSFHVIAIVSCFPSQGFCIKVQGTALSFDCTGVP